MPEMKIRDLPQDVLEDIINRLPLKERSRLEAVSKQVQAACLENVAEIKTILARREVYHLADWLSKLKASSQNSMRRLQISSVQQDDKITAEGKAHLSSSYVKICTICTKLFTLARRRAAYACLCSLCSPHCIRCQLSDLHWGKSMYDTLNHSMHFLLRALFALLYSLHEAEN